MKKVLIAYYSWSNGNTERIAKLLQKEIGGAELKTSEEKIKQWTQKVKALL